MSFSTELTARQAKFVAEYVLDFNGAGAAVRAGVAPAGAHVWASRTLRIPKVSEALRARQAADATRLGIARDDVLRTLLVAVQKGRELGDPAAMVSGLREIARLMGFYPDSRVKVDVAVIADVHTDRMNRLSDAELMKIIESGGATAAESRGVVLPARHG